ncbi:MAG: hypothetical protein EOO23_05425 [Comamonadaceae bacterium]|nr:MAG: hypothetical protein EOO23_05425 [Comamonadaceae bacterium]
MSPTPLPMGFKNWPHEQQITWLARESQRLIDAVEAANPPKRQVDDEEDTAPADQNLSIASELIKRLERKDRMQSHRESDHVAEEE